MVSKTNYVEIKKLTEFKFCEFFLSPILRDFGLLQCGLFSLQGPAYNHKMMSMIHCTKHRDFKLFKRVYTPAETSAQP